MLSKWFALAWIFFGVVGNTCWADDPATMRALERVQRDDETRPRLVLNARGHTAEVHALGFTSDSARLCTGGVDKIVEVWDVGTAIGDVPAGQTMRAIDRHVLLERTIRWQISRGLRGGIHALAASPTGNVIAFAGTGASGGVGEIAIVDAAEGTLERVLKEHRSTISSLAFSANGEWLVSQDLRGKTIAWRRLNWEPKVLYDVDEATYGQQQATAIRQQPNRTRPVVVLGTTQALIPVYVGQGPSGQLLWQLNRIDLDKPQTFQTLKTDHVGMVTALASNKDGRRWISADQAGQVFFWEAGQNTPVHRNQIGNGRVALSLSLSPDGNLAAIGTNTGRESARVSLWNWNAGKPQFHGGRDVAMNVTACAISPDGQKIAYSGGEWHGVHVGKVSDFESTRPLVSTARPIVKVAFIKPADNAEQADRYRFAYGTEFNERGFNDYGSLQQSFDPVGLALQDEATTRDSTWLDVNWSAGAWRAELQPGPAGIMRLQLSRDGRARGHVSFDPEFHGRPTSYCWLAHAQSPVPAIAVGTDKDGAIFVCKLVDQGECPILRHFRGHSDRVTSLGVSSDLKYLLSGSFDGTTRVWSLVDFAQGQTPRGRWGVEFAVNGNRLIAKSVEPAGPLYFKGVRSGDVLDRIRWVRPNETEPVEEKQPAEILKQLESMSLDTPLVFDFVRDGGDLPSFLRLPAWDSLATLLVNVDREWAYWTPEGYYDASFNGHKLFGWQVNRGVDALPVFHRADQFRQRLERPEVMERLLTAGHLESAFRVAVRKPAEDRPDELVKRLANGTPVIRILSPRVSDSVNGASAIVRAEVDMPRIGGKLANVYAYANGVIAAPTKPPVVTKTPEGEKLAYEWTAPLASDPRHLIQVLASTEEVAQEETLVVERSLTPRAVDRPPRLFMLSVGVNEYRNDVGPLTYAVPDALETVNIFKTKGASLYSVQTPLLLLDEKATPKNWTSTFEQLTNQLRNNVQPDDVLLVFMSGHGIVDDITQQYYFCSYDLTKSDFDRRVYSGCISWQDFRHVSGIPCRKLVILDTCHSGAVQPPRSQQLKAAVRAFQDSMIFTVTASAGHERAQERSEWGHGAFTKSLLEALSGAADAPRGKFAPDGVITLDELTAYVTKNVADLTDGRQNPTASPSDILPYISLPLTRVK